MRPVVSFTAGVLTLAIAGPVVAQEFKLSGDLFGQTKPAPKPPKVDWGQPPLTAEDQPAKPSVICGMTLVRADPKADPKMRVAPEERRTRYTLKTVEPTVCMAR
ncbi:MAG: hypothetical protein JWL71_4633 [Acidobacteria bacterium]|nr:hypothetical protein [Acidobacteriota bacterium]